MSKIAGELNAEMNRAVRDDYRVLFAEMVRKTGSNQSVLDRLVQEISSLREQVSDLEASPLSEEALDILRSKNTQLEAERDSLAAQNDAIRKALYKLACLGNGDQFGNSIGNSIAQDALNLPNLSAEVLKRRDAKVLREAADRFEAVDPHPKHWDWLRRMANEIDGKEAT